MGPTWEQGGRCRIPPELLSSVVTFSAPVQIRWEPILLQFLFLLLERYIRQYAGLADLKTFPALLLKNLLSYGPGDLEESQRASASVAAVPCGVCQWP